MTRTIDFSARKEKIEDESATRNLTSWYHGDYIKGQVNGQMVFDYLKLNNLLDDCATLKELEKIQQRGSFFFRGRFGGQVVIAWQTLVDKGEDRWVSGLIEINGEAVIRLFLVNRLWTDNFVALRVKRPNTATSSSSESTGKILFLKRSL